MTIADRQHALAVRRLSAPAALRWLAVRWEVRDGELRGVLEWRILDEPARHTGAPAAVAIWQHESGAAGVVVATVGAAEARSILRTADGAAGLEHIDIPGRLALTIRRDSAGGGVTVVYARTTALAALGARGGRTDTPCCVVLHTAHDEAAAMSGPPPISG